MEGIPKAIRNAFEIKCELYSGDPNKKPTAPKADYIDTIGNQYRFTQRVSVLLISKKNVYYSCVICNESAVVDCLSAPRMTEYIGNGLKHKDILKGSTIELHLESTNATRFRLISRRWIVALQIYFDSLNKETWGPLLTRNIDTVSAMGTLESEVGSRNKSKSYLSVITKPTESLLGKIKDHESKGHVLQGGYIINNPGTVEQETITILSGLNHKKIMRFHLWRSQSPAEDSVNVDISSLSCLLFRTEGNEKADDNPEGKVSYIAMDPRISRAVTDGFFWNMVNLIMGIEVRNTGRLELKMENITSGKMLTARKRGSYMIELVEFERQTEGTLVELSGMIRNRGLQRPELYDYTLHSFFCHNASTLATVWNLKSEINKLAVENLRDTISVNWSLRIYCHQDQKKGQMTLGQVALLMLLWEKTKTIGIFDRLAEAHEDVFFPDQ